MYNMEINKDVIGKDISPFTLDRISPSMIGTYLSCPLSFYYGYIAKIQLPTTRIHLSFGSAIHKSIEEMYNGHTNPQEVFKAMFKREDLDDEGKAMFGEYYMLGLEMLKNYLEAHPELDAIYGLNSGQSELRFRRFIINPMTGEPSNVPLSGVVDRLTQNVSNIIVEYKTSKTEWDPSETRFKVQSLLYNLWHYAEHGKIADKTLYIVLLKKHKRTKRDSVMQIIEYVPTIEDLTEAWYEMQCILAEIESGKFERPAHGHPRFCDCYKYEALLGIKH